MALADYTPVLQWYADALTDLDQPTGATPSNPGSTTSPTIAGSGDLYADNGTSNGISFAPVSPVNNSGTGGITIVLKARFDTTSAGRIVAENYDGSGTDTSDVGWQIVNSTGTSRRVALALPPIVYSSERLESAEYALTAGQDFIVAFRRSGTTWTMWLDDNASGGMISHTPSTNTIPGDANFSSCGTISFGTSRTGASPFDGRIYWLVAFDAALSDADLQLAAWDDEANLKSAWLSGGGAVSGTIAETASAADTVSATVTHVATIAESASAADSLSAILSALAAISETGDAQFAPITGASISAAIVETATAVDSVSSVLNAAAALAETGSAADSYSAIASLVAALSEAMNATDSVSWGGAVYSVDIVEAANATDTLTAAVNALAALAEAGNATDTVSALASLQAALAEAGTALDTLTVTGVYGVSVSEAGDITFTVSVDSGILPGTPARSVTVRAANRTITVRAANRTVTVH